MPRGPQRRIESWMDDDQDLGSFCSAIVEIDGGSGYLYDTTTWWLLTGLGYGSAPGSLDSIHQASSARPRRPTIYP